MRFRPLVISLPLVLWATQLMNPMSVAEAAGMDATQATALLAKSQAIDVKCSVLAKDKSQNLRDFVARAEISLAEKVSVAVARKTISGGRSEGKLVTCDAAAAKLVNDVLAAATVAVAAPIADATTIDKPKTVAATPTPPAPQAKVIAIVEAEPVQKPNKTLTLVKAPKPKVKTAPVKAVQTAKSEKPVKSLKSVKGLGSYAAVAEKYYVAARCGSMSASEISRLYKTVLTNHQQALTSNRPRDVRAMLRAAETKAGNKSCG
jgi:outer membrane biosynthesis protein TonB